MTRGGRARTTAEPERRCIVTRAVLPKRHLLRFVVGPDSALVPDLAGRLPGRGLWVRADADVLAEAVRTNAFARAARARVAVPADLPAQVEQGLARRLADAVALARKAGQAVAGREKTVAALASGEAALLLQAADGSVRERAELRPPEGAETRFTCLSAAELGMVFGRDRVIHAAVLAGGLADRVREEALRLSGVRARGNRQPYGHGAEDDVAGEGSRGKG